MRNTTPQEIEGVLELDGPTRFAHFVKRAADEELVWGLWHDGWALMADANAQSVFPLWPAREYAALCATGEWDRFAPEEIPLSALVGELLPKLAAQGVCPAVFPTPKGRGVTVTVSELAEALRTEMAKYE